MSEKVLFIGGTADGQRHEVDEDVHTYQIPVPVDSPLELNPPMRTEMPECHVYRTVQLSEGSDQQRFIRRVMLWDRYDEDYVISQLINGYGRA